MVLPPSDPPLPLETSGPLGATSAPSCANPDFYGEELWSEVAGKPESAETPEDDADSNFDSESSLTPSETSETDFSDRD